MICNYVILIQFGKMQCPLVHRQKKIMKKLYCSCLICFKKPYLNRHVIRSKKIKVFFQVSRESYQIYLHIFFNAFGLFLGFINNILEKIIFL